MCLLIYSKWSLKKIIQLLKLWQKNMKVLESIQYYIIYVLSSSVIVALAGLPIGYSVIVTLTGLPIGYSVIVTPYRIQYNSSFNRSLCRIQCNNSSL